MMKEWGPVTSRTVDLGYQQLLSMQAHEGRRIRVLFGDIWLTEEGYVQDVFASSGDEVALKSRGRAVLEARGMARIEMIDPVREPLWAPLRRWLLRRASRRQAAARGATAPNAQAPV